ncbi:acyl-CoA thioesterase [Planctobacterium marinum]|uniref:Acyl-CoA thioesterase n=1 Tax=Planctobacterium marinum TaxID=1631968 RepID=A0AA48KT89_9ALTE|nr:acyl-CoA thioesterase [Planctobacterium marinum]
MLHKREIDFRFLAEPTDVNFGGKVHGGMVMKWLDQAGYACASQWSGSYCVTVSVGGIRFKKPILVGQKVVLNAKVVHTGKTSMHIFITVNAGDPKELNLQETCTCIISFVAVDDDGAPVEVDHWEPITEEDKLLEQFAIHAKEFSQRLQAEL